jgi:hypothetical protein
VRSSLSRGAVILPLGRSEVSSPLGRCEVISSRGEVSGYCDLLALYCDLWRCPNTEHTASKSPTLSLDVRPCGFKPALPRNPAAPEPGTLLSFFGGGGAGRVA